MDRWRGVGPVGLHGRFILPGDDPDAFEAISSCAELEPWAELMMNHVARRLRDVLEDGYRTRCRRERVPTPGPDFRYEISDDLFSGRTGSGPLSVAWDTNLLSDYFNYGARLWTGATAAQLVPEGTDRADRKKTRYAMDLEFLQHVFGLWTLRDIRFLILPATLSDALPRRDERSDEAAELLRQARIASHFRQRQAAFWEFAAALALVDNTDDEEGERRLDAGLLHLSASQLEAALRPLPKGYDTVLVRQAVQVGAQVFLTRDHKVLQASGGLRPFGLFVTSPTGLWRALLKHGAFDCLLDRESAYWPMRDTLRTAHLLHALDFHAYLERLAIPEE